ncbi:MAG: hypothetical protein RI539_05695 [Spiribacter sp.]|jgi:hypothetical protein|nr:hypothetical protein [Spiribacter sp.]MDR9489821.1 hypothetical protein [Spiribacter sp.]
MNGYHDSMANTSIIQRFVGLVSLRAGPEDIPYSTGLLGLVIALAAGLNIPVIQQYTPDAQPLIHITLMVSYNAAFLWMALAIRRYGARFVQTATALFGADAIISLIALPILLIIGQPNETNALAGLAFFALLIWNIAVVNHILRSALSLSGMISLGLTLVYIFGASLFVRAVVGL